MEILASTDIRYIYIKLCQYLIVDPIFHYIYYALLNFTLHAYFTG